ncbi:hemolysin secretion protein D [Polynucleobacter sp. SHI8]|uniref:efflux RND transporter periplasmic adaptor subunit n=1 Tax=unclassified Polynucleobacter TaxID=2640945 RepID=UPI002491FDEA|nr:MULTISPECIES: efflux RND transporter periplasmic adaptor subunit [unclassified Polynucleobacter]BDW10701.1 hemolysin secretion protein D [Polynucleobacter sp. SHI2]BDW13147.1 hemolysin secretion protein D [Polynucleobacter sp. SHI8]
MNETNNNSKLSFQNLKGSAIQRFSKNKPLLVVLGVLILGVLIWGFIHLLQGLNKKPILEEKQSAENTVQISVEQAKEIKTGLVASYDFQELREAVGVIDFDKYKTAEVFSPYQGRINKVFVEAGSDVKKGQTLYTVLAPDVAQASSALLSAAGVYKQANETLKRARDLYEFKSISQRELEQNISDHQTAEGNYIAAKKSMALFGFSDAEIDQVISARKVDIELNIKSPINGRVITRNVATGQLVQPGVAPAPMTVSDTTNLWMVAQVPESEAPFYKIGQSVIVKVQAYKYKLFPGKVVYVADSVDPATRRLTLYAQIRDPERELKPQMLASFNIEITKPEPYPAIPAEAVVRENNGTRVVWTTSDGKLFKRRVVSIGITQAGLVQVLDGLQAGEMIALNKALFLSNLYSVTH